MAQIIKFTPGVSEIVALKFDSGQNCEGKFGPQVQFTTTDDRVFWLDPEPANDVENELRALRIAAGAPFRLTKVKTSHGGHRWTVEPVRDAGGHHVPERARETRYAEPAPMTRAAAPEPQRYEAPAPAAITPTSAKLLAAYMLAVDTLLETQVYATRKGLALAVTCEDVRCLAATILIDQQKGGR